MNAAGPWREPHVGRGNQGELMGGAADSAADWERGLTGTSTPGPKGTRSFKLRAISNSYAPIIMRSPHPHF
jgi:hypothetical protein